MDRPPDDPPADDPAEAVPDEPARGGAGQEEPEDPADATAEPPPPAEAAVPATPDPSVSNEAPPTEAAASDPAAPWEGYAPPAAETPEPPDAAQPTAFPLVPPAPDGQVPQYAPPPGVQLPQGYAVPPGDVAAPQFATDTPDAEPKRPGVGPGVATGCGVQVLALILFFLTAGLIPSFYGALWPFILFTVGAALLLISKRWRRFATGALIVCAATWIVVLGPCIAMIQPTM